MQLSFWTHKPALLYGTALLLGFLAALHFNLGLCIFSAVFLFSIFSLKNFAHSILRVLICILVALLAFLYIKTCFYFPEEDQLEGIALFKIEAIIETQSHLQSGWIYKGIIQDFLAKEPQKKRVRGVPCTIFIKKDWQRPKANHSYWIEGILRKYQGKYKLKTQGDAWIIADSQWSFLETRNWSKELWKSYLKTHFASSRVYTFLMGISTGLFDDPLMMREFSRLGLQHIMAISGFHFSLIALFFSFFITFFCRPNWAALILLVILTFYFIFIGNSPSVERAYIMVTIFLLSRLTKNKNVPLNSLGVALIIILLKNPLECLHLGFQLSFLATAAILILIYPTDKLLQTIFHLRSLKEVTRMHLLDQHGYAVLILTRKSLALAIAVHLATIPLILNYFHQFPCSSFIYNLFFPVLTALSMCLLLCGSLFFFLPWLSHFIHQINVFYTDWMLNMTENPPRFLLHTIYMENMSPIFITVIYSFLFLWGVKFSQIDDNKAGLRWS